MNGPGALPGNRPDNEQPNPPRRKGHDRAERRRRACSMTAVPGDAPPAAARAAPTAAATGQDHSFPPARPAPAWRDTQEEEESSGILAGAEWKKECNSGARYSSDT